MISTAPHNQPSSEETSLSLAQIAGMTAQNNDEANHAALFLNYFIMHTPRSGLNPLADAAAPLFSIMGRLSQILTYHHLNKLQKELIQQINIFHNIVKNQGYGTEYLLICRHVLCATLDDLIAHTPWGDKEQWRPYSLIAACEQDAAGQEDKFFILMERIIQEPVFYIDLMEMMYLCLSMGYMGRYRSAEENPHDLEHITHTLYKHIRTYRGDFTKILSPLALKPRAAKKIKMKRPSFWVTALVTFSIILGIFISFGYFQQRSADEAYQHLTNIGKALSYAAS